MAENDLVLLQQNATGKWMRRTVAAVGRGLLRFSNTGTPFTSGAFLFSNSASVTVNTTAVETTLLHGSLSGSKSLAITDLVTGRLIRAKGWAVLGHTSGTHTLKLKLGSTDLLGSGFTIGTTAGGGVLTFDIFVTGISGNLVSFDATMEFADSANGTVYSLGTSADQIVDFTTPQDVALTVTHSISDAANSFVLHSLFTVAL